MPYALEWVRDGRLVKVKHFGDVTTNEIQDSLSEIQQENGLADRPYVLVDVRACTTYPKIADLYFLAETNVYRPRVSKKTAFVFDQRTAETINFVVVTASNRGFAVQAFTEEDSAIDWLLGPSQAP